jgi:hypothetical protein
MNDYAKSATQDFIEAVREQDIIMVARRLDSKAFKAQAREFIRNHWDEKSDSEILADLEFAGNQHKSYKKWELICSVSTTGNIDLIPMSVIQKLPDEAFHMYQYNLDSSYCIKGYETLLSALLRKRGLPKEYKDHLKTLENLPSFSKDDPVSRKVIEELHPTVGSIWILNQDDPFLPECMEAPWYEEYMQQIEARKIFNSPPKLNNS